MTTLIKKCSLDNVHDLQKISIETFTETFQEHNSPEHLHAYLEKAYHLQALEQ